MARFCPRCGAPAEEEQRFCGKCGQAIPDAPKEVPSPAQGEAPGEAPARTARTDGPGAIAAAIGAGRDFVGKTKADAQAGEAVFELPELSAAAGGVFGSLPLASILAGLGAGGVSCAALWNAKHPLLLSLLIAAAIIGGKFAFGKIRGRRG